MFRVRFLVVFICAILASNVAYSAFKTSRIGGSKGLVVTPVADLLSELQSIFSNFPNQLPSSQQLQDLHVNVDAFGGYPLSDHHLRYIALLMNGLNLGTSQANLQSLFNQNTSDSSSACPSSECAQAAADWVHEQVSDNSSSSIYGQWSLITPDLLDDLIGTPGYTQALLTAGGGSISTIQQDGAFQGLSNLPGRSDLPNATTIKEIINEAAGFVAAVADDPNSFEDEDYTDAQTLVDHFLDNDDYSGFTLANFLACYNNNEESRSGGPDTCDISASDWASRSSELTYFAEAKTALGTAGTVLTEAQISNIGLTLPSTPSPLPEYARAYLSAQFKVRENAENTSDWQAIVTAYNDETASRWYLHNAAASTGSSRATTITMTPGGTSETVTIADIANSSVTEALLLAAGMSTTILTDTGVTLTDLQSGIRNSGLAANLTGTEIDDYVITTAGYGSGTTVADIQAASANGWPADQYRSATTYGGWATSAAAFTSYTNCRTNGTDDTGGAGNCIISGSAWTSIEEIETAVNDNTTITSDNLDAIIVSASGGSSNLDYSSNQMHLAYMTDCINGLTSRTIANMAACATDGSARQSAARYGIANFESNFPLDDSTLSDAGVASDMSSLLGDTDSSSCFDTDCASVMRSFLLQDNVSLTSSSSSSDIQTALITAFEDYYVSKANEVPAVTNSNAPSLGSCALRTNPVPGLCSHQPDTHIYCTSPTDLFSVQNNLQVQYDGRNNPVSTATYINYSLVYHSRLSNRVLRTEQRVFEITPADSQGNSWSTVTRQMCENSGFRGDWLGRTNTASKVKRCCTEHYNGVVSTEDQLKDWAFTTNNGWGRLDDDAWAVSNDDRARTDFDHSPSFTTRCGSGKIQRDEHIRYYTSGYGAGNPSRYYYFCKYDGDVSSSGMRVRCNRPTC